MGGIWEGGEPKCYSRSSSMTPGKGAEGVNSRSEVGTL